MRIKQCPGESAHALYKTGKTPSIICHAMNEWLKNTYHYLGRRLVLDRGAIRCGVVDLVLRVSAIRHEARCSALRRWAALEKAGSRGRSFNEAAIHSSVALSVLQDVMARLGRRAETAKNRVATFG